jgi:hypothetical protein
MKLLFFRQPTMAASQQHQHYHHGHDQQQDQASNSTNNRMWDQSYLDQTVTSVENTTDTERHEQMENIDDGNDTDNESSSCSSDSDEIIFEHRPSNSYKNDAISSPLSKSSNHSRTGSRHNASASSSPLWEVQNMAANETRSLFIWKTCVIFTIFITAVIVCTGTFFVLDSKEHDDFLDGVRYATQHVFLSYFRYS